jgi:hypothetical protein
MMDHQPDAGMTDRPLWDCRAPALIAMLLIVSISAFNLHRLVSAEAPRNPWESCEILEGWRSLQGMPVYELPPKGHATHMYGALAPWVQGRIFRWVGPNNVSGRALSLVSALLMVTLIAASTISVRSAWYFAIGWTAIIGVSHRSGHYFAENRPDMPALLLATLFIIFSYNARCRLRWLNIVLGSTCLVAGFFFKQTVWIFSAVPLVALILRRERPQRADLLFASIPLAVSIALILGLRLFSPKVYYYMIAVPGGYSIHWPRAVKFLWEMLLDSPLFLFLLGEFIFFDTDSHQSDPRVPWLFALLAVAIPFSAVAHAKVGGWPNSELPALLGMMAFCALRLPRLLMRLENLRSSRRIRFAYGSFVSLLLLMTTFPHLTYANNLFVAKSIWDAGYWQAVAMARDLPGTVVCPEDPTIPLYARQYTCQNLFIEKDARPFKGLWPTATPEPVLEELRAADYVIDITDYWGDNLDGRTLEELGFEPAHEDSSSAEHYRLWRRRTSGNNRTASLETRPTNAD